MTLADYVQQVGYDAAAAAFGVTRGAVWQWINGRTRPRPEIAVAAHRLTKGAVSPFDMRPDLFARDKP